MFLTPKDIHDKTFKRSFKGYDENEVDEFLDLIIKEFNILIDENERLRQEILSIPVAAKGSSGAGELKRLEDMVSTVLDGIKKNTEIVEKISLREEEGFSDEKEKAKEKEELEKEAERSSRLNDFKKVLGEYKENFDKLIEEQKKQLNEKYSEIVSELNIISTGAGKPEKNAQKTAETEKNGDKKSVSKHEKIKEASDAGVAEDLIKAGENKQKPQAARPQFLSDTKIEEQIKSEASPMYRGGAKQEEEKPEAEKKEDKSEEQDNGRFKPNYSEYAWLYKEKDIDSESEQGNPNLDVSFRNPKEKEELKRLIDEVID